MNLFQTNDEIKAGLLEDLAIVDCRLSAFQIQAIHSILGISHDEVVRKCRNEMLTDSDWAMFSDSPLTELSKATWATYRQALRDVTTQDGFPWTVQWPTQSVQ